MEELFTGLIKGFFGLFIVFGGIWVLITYMVSPVKTFGLIHSRWHKPFDDVQFSTKEFYVALEEAIKKRGVSDIQIHHVNHASYHFLSSSREYLQIRREDSMFLVCAAPFGTGYFISWWLGQTISFWQDLVPRIPWIGKGLALFIFSKTFYEMDTDTMFKGVIQHSVLEVIDSMTSAKGIRALTELERMPIDIPAQSRRI